MLGLDEALRGLSSAQEKLRNATAIISPVIMSEQMIRLSQYAGALDEHLAEFEREYDIQLAAKILNKHKEGMKISPAETLSKMELSEVRGQISYLSRISSSAWRQVGTIQSRINHLVNESKTNI